MNKKKTPFFSAGISLILLVFILLCLLTFAVLSLTSANADLRLSKKTAERISEYYAAESAAGRILKDIDGLLLEQYNNSRDRGEYEAHFLEEAAGWDSFRAERTRDGVRIYVTQNIGDEELLEVELAVCYPEEEGGSLYRIESWKSVQKAGWQPDQKLPVLQKEG